MPDIDTVVDTAAGPLNAILCTPEGPARGGLVLSDGSGPADRHAWQGVPQWLAARGIATLRHDKPGCGGSPGDWRHQTFADRAAEAIAALAVLRKQAGVERAGLIGYSQGGWVSLLAAVTVPDHVDFVVTVGGPFVGVEEQERTLLGRVMRRHGLAEESVAAGLAWADERAARLAAGEDPAQVYADQARFAGDDWAAIVCDRPYDTPEELGFFARMLPFDPGAALPFLPCPLMAFFGADDEHVPVERSLAVLGDRLPGRYRGSNGVAVLPGVGHMLYPVPPRADMSVFAQLSPGFLPLLGAFLDRVAPDHP
ncbi:alpha/beta hydrolase family protein [Dactylosporangium sp. CS-047395]|uniref:alpha/beta hydrolase family protein n=1 Tax=Dactylosporangium sp. CS-047395 TaxID=3239936 RepID=UPI003D8C79A0